MINNTAISKITTQGVIIVTICIRSFVKTNIKDKLPETTETFERFEMPKATGHIQGNKTIVTNFSALVSAFRREATQILKYLQRELAAPATIDGPRLVLGRKLNSALINQKIEQYAKDFVICTQCGKPDTELRKEGAVTIMKCTACGAKHPVKAKL